ncbi:YtxH domain-containing protein [Thermoflexus sp.]|uniref:YtxH domain-containing protein n=1 Tax=Thermoflexus sp. TaxID=1969742 RepID=UPI0035E41F70
MTERERDGEFGAFLAGFLTGALVGAVVALLFAPRPGEETRRLLRERGIELKTQAEEVTAQVRSQTEAALLEARRRAEEAAAEARRRAEELRKWLEESRAQFEQMMAQRRGTAAPTTGEPPAGGESL